MNEILRAAWVIARRDFTALVRSKAFIAFLIGPIIMLGVALAAGTVGAKMAGKPVVPVIGIAMNEGDAERLLSAYHEIDQIVAGLPALEKIRHAADPAGLLRDGQDGQHYAAILSGSLDHPRLDTTGDGADIWPERAKLLIDQARRDGAFVKVPLDVRTITTTPTTTAAPTQVNRSSTAQYGQMALFLSTMLLAGMVLSNLVEEKTNKIIEVLASSIPLEAIFLGKLFAMLAMALIAIGLWVGLGGSAIWLLGPALPSMPPPAVGWPVFLILGILYFSTAYLLLGSAYLSIGAMAATVRDVQTLSMPVSMAQLGVFLAASYAMAQPGSAVEIAACLFPFTSPFALLARAALAPELWPHLLLIVWQGLWTWAIIRAGTALFRRNVMKSTGGGRRRGRKPGTARVS
ncbi:MAG TPA: ABC transporter permease [Sphingobium sp.]|uniref:ABC transporter permease n=1 Tax=Sphingobium sp. TaxID=1912891 RepID=UPI002ED3BB4A